MVSLVASLITRFLTLLQTAGGANPRKLRRDREESQEELTGPINAMHVILRYAVVVQYICVHCLTTWTRVCNLVVRGGYNNPGPDLRSFAL